MTKALILHSGGIDSSTCLAIAIVEYGVSNVESIGINYGQRHSTELDYAQKLCDHYGVKRRVLQLPTIEGSILTDPNADIPKVDYSEIEGLSPAYVPFRNGLMLSNCAAVAQAEGFDLIYYGAHAEDALNWAYPDCTPEFNGSMANAIFIGTNQKVQLITPFQWSTKVDILLRGTGLDVPYELTWSCYVGADKHCGTCSTCRARHQGFEDANLIDPTEYEELAA